MSSANTPLLNSGSSMSATTGTTDSIDMNSGATGETRKVVTGLLNLCIWCVLLFRLYCKSELIVVNLVLKYSLPLLMEHQWLLKMMLF